MTNTVRLGDAHGAPLRSSNTSAKVHGTGGCTDFDGASLPKAAFNSSVKLLVYASTALGFNESDPKVVLMDGL
jgi:hypothetical protein